MIQSGSGMEDCVESFLFNSSKTGDSAILNQQTEALISLRRKVTKLLPDEVALADAYVDRLLKSRPVKTGDGK